MSDMPHASVKDRAGLADDGSTGERRRSRAQALGVYAATVVGAYVVFGVMALIGNLSRSSDDSLNVMAVPLILAVFVLSGWGELIAWALGLFDGGDQARLMGRVAMVSFPLSLWPAYFLARSRTRRELLEWIGLWALVLVGGGAAYLFVYGHMRRR